MAKRAGSLPSLASRRDHFQALCGVLHNACYADHRIMQRLSEESSKAGRYLYILARFPLRTSP